MYGKLCTDNKKIANAFNTFFTLAVMRLKQSLDLCSNERRFSHAVNRSLPDFKFKMADESFTLNALRQLKTSKANGHNGISPRLLKDAAEVISKPLTQIIIVPQEWNQTRVTPLFKRVSTDMDNYRPISFLPVASRWSGLFTIICTVSAMNTSYLVLLSMDLEQITLTEFAVVAFSDFVRHGLDQGLLTGVMFLDLHKAFDYVDHDLWINRLESY